MKSHHLACEASEVRVMAYKQPFVGAEAVKHAFGRGQRAPQAAKEPLLKLGWNQNRFLWRLFNIVGL